MYQVLCSKVEAASASVALLSPAFVSEVLTSRTSPPASKFHARDGPVIKMHMEKSAVELRMRPHDSTVLGSPCLGIRPSVVR